jgi:hypothetical protein
MGDASESEKQRQSSSFGGEETEIFTQFHWMRMNEKTVTGVKMTQAQSFHSDRRKMISKFDRNRGKLS